MNAEQTLKQIESYVHEVIVKNLEQPPGEDVRMYKTEGAEWVVLENIRELARNALKNYRSPLFQLIHDAQEKLQMHKEEKEEPDVVLDYSLVVIRRADRTFVALTNTHGEVYEKYFTSFQKAVNGAATILQKFADEHSDMWMREHDRKDGS